MSHRYKFKRRDRYHRARIYARRDEYIAACRQRWMGEQLDNAFRNFWAYQRMHRKLRAAMPEFRRCHRSLHSFLWDLQERWNPDRSRLDPLLDFCDHYQRVFLRRGLIIYCQMLLNDSQNRHRHAPDSV